MALLSPKVWLQAPEAWKELFDSARQKHSPFIIQLKQPETNGNTGVDRQNISRTWVEHVLTHLYIEKENSQLYQYGR